MTKGELYWSDYDGVVQFISHNCECGERNCGFVMARVLDGLWADQYTWIVCAVDPSDFEPLVTL